MCNLRDIAIFFAGFQVFHTMSHIYLWYTDMLPHQTPFLELTVELNWVAVAVNGVIALALLAYACRK